MVRNTTMVWLLIIVLSICITFAYGALSAAPWVPLWQRDIPRILAIVQSRISPSDATNKKFIELSASDERTLAAVSLFGMCAIGYEISLLPFCLAWCRKIMIRASYKMYYKNFWQVSCADADVVFFFLMPGILPKLSQKLLAEIRPGTLVISYVWPIPGWDPVVVDELAGAPKIFMYERT